MQPSPLIGFAIEGLRQCYMPQHRLWSYKCHLDGRPSPNQTRPAFDVFYSLNVLLGASKLSEPSRALLGVDLEAMFNTAVSRIESSGAPGYAYGTALWTAAELGLPAPHFIVERIQAVARDARSVANLTAQEVGMLLSGLVAQTRADPSWSLVAKRLRDHILTDLRTDSDLFRDCAVGARRRFGTFASQVYCLLGLYSYAEATGDLAASTAANSCVRKLISLQGPYGEWPWFFDVKSGRVADFYEVYSVHQHGMAPAALKHAIRHQVPGAKEALRKGFAWILGENELGCSMLRPALSLIARSQARRGLQAGRLMRACRGSFNVLASRPGKIRDRPRDIVITPETRSYELGWTLWSFGDDADFPELTHHSAFNISKSSAKTQVVKSNYPALALSSQGL